MKLASQQYGKQRVRLLKVIRQEPRQEIQEIEVSLLLEGAFEQAYRSDDNHQVIATDTMKNTIQCLALDHLGSCLESFALILADHFLGNYPQVSAAHLRIEQAPWERLAFDGQPHAHSFAATGLGRQVVQLDATREHRTIRGGLRDATLIKSTGSGFANFHRDEFRTLPDVRDRVLCSRLRAAWVFAAPAPDYEAANERIRRALVRRFCDPYSPSVQRTLFLMGEAALEAAPEIASISLVMPNVHYVPISLDAFGRENPNILFTPTDEPHGEIEAVVTRD
jgi:urate oxidase